VHVREESSSVHGRPEVLRVDQIPDTYVFASDSQDVELAKDFLPKESKDYDSFWFSKEDLSRGEITHAYGMSGSVPYNEKMVHLITK
jgi:hypothetical protein